MTDAYEPIGTLLRRVRSRWRTRVVLQSSARAMCAAAAASAAGALIARWTASGPVLAAIVFALGLLGAVAALAWGLWPVRRSLSDAQVARFIEERHPELDDRLATAVGLGPVSESDRPALAASMIGDAARAASTIEAADVVATDSVRRAGLQAAAAALVLAGVLVGGAGTARRSFDAFVLRAFPSRITIEVTPGDARVRAGSNVTVTARLVGSSAQVPARLLRSSEADGALWEPLEMRADRDQQFAVELSDLASSFRYRVVADAAASDTFRVTVVRPPKVRRIDVEYLYPNALTMKPRLERDGGDIYAPAGTNVRLHVLTDAPAASGRMVLDRGAPVDLRPEQPSPDSGAGGSALVGHLKVDKDGSYRIALADAENVTSSGDTEYFIRAIEDRPPDVHVTKPAGDRRVTPLEEIGIEADATDDFGVASLDLVYAVRGGSEKTVALSIAAGATSVSGRRILYLEDLDVRPGDFVSYYVKARDLGRGRASREGRSDIFFLEVKPFEEEFTLAQSQASMGGSASSAELDDLVSAQKDIIVATWKLDRRSQAARGARSDADIRAVGRAQGELRTRVERSTSAFRTGMMRTPRRRTPLPQGETPAGPHAGEALAEEDAMGLAAQAMGRAVVQLDALDTAGAMGPEMEALNQLLRAQADVKKRQVQQQTAGAGGSNRRTQDLSSLFDKELARNQQTNYEASKNAGQSGRPQAGPIDEIRDLARRQDELLRQQQELARQQAAMTAEELKRQLERLTRDQNDLRQRAETLAEQLSRESQGSSSPQSASGQPRASGQAEQQGQSTRGGSGRSLREVSEEMRSTAHDLGNRDATEASRRAERALEGLRQLEQQLQSGSADGRRRALGDMQLEARQLADDQRRIAGESRRSASDPDAVRRLSAEQARLAGRTRRLGQNLKQQASTPVTGAERDRDAAQALRAAAGEAGREIERQRLADRMEQSAEAMQRTGQSSSTRAGGPASTPAGSDARAEEELARALDRLADRLASAGQDPDAESQKLSGQLARARDLRDRLDRLTSELEQLQTRAGRTGAAGGSSGSSGEAERLREEVAREMQEVRRLLDQVRRDDPGNAGRGAGRTLEGAGMVLSDPGTQGFKQDFAQWRELKSQATAALQRVESSVVRRLQDRQSRDRLASGAADRAPVPYQEQVDRYFKALASGKKP